MRYISLFSGIGGLEHASMPPVLCCEVDPVCRPVLERRFPGVPIHDDVTSLDPARYLGSGRIADVITGGWPCQDISIAGSRGGLAGKRSRLFYEMVRIARMTGAHTIVAENVPHLLQLREGREFASVVTDLVAAGFPYIAWRTLNARQFGLPHQRLRLFLIASKHEGVARALHRPLPDGLAEATGSPPVAHGFAAGFYWTAGSQSICYSRGYCPTLKVGSGLSIPSPPAVHFEDCVRKLTPRECLRLQGFDPGEFSALAASDIHRLAGNAVARPVGTHVMSGLEDILWNNSAELDFVDDSPVQPTLLHGHDELPRLPVSGVRMPDRLLLVRHLQHEVASNLPDFIDREDRSLLSPRAARGLLTRLARSAHSCPPDLRHLLERIAA